MAKWFHEDDEITPSDDFRIIIEDDVIKLVFVEVFPDDSGKYTCVISNRDGEKTSSCILTVLGKCLCVCVCGGGGGAVTMN